MGLPSLINQLSGSAMYVRFLLTCCLLCLFACFEEDEEKENMTRKQSSLERNEIIKENNLEIEALKWENTRLALKLRTVKGENIVKHNVTGLFHFDVERAPFTGLAIETFEDGNPKAEISFLKGYKDGMQRYWYPEGSLKEESQWFDGMLNGLVRYWDQNGRLIKILRYKNGNLIEVIRE